MSFTYAEDLPASKEAVYALDDFGLIRAIHLILFKREALQLPLSAWEREFGESVVASFKLSPDITWRQRKSMREIVWKVVQHLMHRAAVDAALKESEIEA